MSSDQKPTVVLVHGAFADGTSWEMVIERLQTKGYTVQAPAIALRGVTVDSEYLTSVVKQIDGPVLLVGHSYGGALITNVDAPNVVPCDAAWMMATTTSGSACPRISGPHDPTKSR